MPFVCSVEFPTESFPFFSEAKAVIEGPDEKYIKAGSNLKLVCRFENVTQHPETVFWWVSLDYIK